MTKPASARSVSEKTEPDTFETLLRYLKLRLPIEPDVDIRQLARDIGGLGRLTARLLSDLHAGTRETPNATSRLERRS